MAEMMETTAVTETVESQETTPAETQVTEGATLLEQAAAEAERQTETDGDKAAPDEPENEDTDGGEREEGEEEKSSVPEKYELSMPEGWTVDEKALEAFTPIMKELGCSNEQAQKLADVFIQQVSARRSADIELLSNEVKRWEEELKNDEEIGGAKLNENLSYTAKVLMKYGGPDVRQLLDDTGLGSHPGFVKMLVKLGRAVSDDEWVDGTQGAAKSYLDMSDEERTRALLPKASKLL